MVTFIHSSRLGMDSVDIGSIMCITDNNSMGMLLGTRLIMEIEVELTRQCLNENHTLEGFSDFLLDFLLIASCKF